MGFSKEPVVWANAISGILLALFPALVLFGILDWSGEQLAGVEVVMAAVVAAVAAVTTRAKVSPTSE